MHNRVPEAIVAGHICLDIIPSIQAREEGVEALLIPGKLVELGATLLSTGGAVSNTGLAMHRLGVPVKLMGKIGDDVFGRAIATLLDEHGAGLSAGLIMETEAQSSYTFVISPPNVDRIFLHSTGTNDTFQAADVRTDALQGSKLFHFGYPPLMRNMYRHGGEELAALLSKVKKQGLTVSLDMAKPDPDSQAGQVDWVRILKRALPHVDLFQPSFEEILFMLRREQYDMLMSQHKTTDILPYANGELLASLSEELLAMGVAIVGIKLGEHGLYVRSSPDAERLAAMGALSPPEDQLPLWTGRELLAPSYQVDVVGTTGAGDCTIAGLLAGLVKGLPLTSIVRSAVAVGACNVERADAISGVPDWEHVIQRIANGWTQRELTLHFPNWHYDEHESIYERST